MLLPAALLSILIATAARADLTVLTAAASPGGFSLTSAAVLVDDNVAPVVHQAADLLADDVGRVTGVRPAVYPSSPRPWRAVPAGVVVVGTLGDGGAVDQLVAAGKVDATGVRDQWETFAWQLVDGPVSVGGLSTPALVILGSDRRGTAYGCTELSKAIGVSPWNWWADVPTPHCDKISVTAGRHIDGPPGVKYRGIFFNDEDFGFRPWASKTFDPKLGLIGPNTYAKVYELMLRLRLNYLWPAMHSGEGSSEFGSVPGNAEMADKWAVVIGASHCEPMLRDNLFNWDKTKQGPWRYDVNRDNILKYWAESVDQRGNFEAVWTLGIRGIHDSPMQGPREIPARVKMVDGIIVDQRKLIDAKVTHQYGPPAEVLVPYKEVLPIYDAGLSVPDDVTLMWPDDNFGYIRHQPTPAERKRAGGNGIYYHYSYWGGPKSYLWVESTPPGLTWEELHKAYQNGVDRMWIVNVGDLKPAELALDFYARLAWSPDRWGPDAQDRFLQDFLASTFGPKAAGPLQELESAYYRLATIRRPDQFSYGWANGLSQTEFDDRSERYVALAKLEHDAAAAVPADHRDAYFEMVGYAARMLAATGQLYTHHGEESQRQMDYIRAETRRYNEEIAGGKWRDMMSITPHDVAWPKEVGGNSKGDSPKPGARPANPKGVTIDAALFAATGPAADGKWVPVAGLGYSGRAITVLPVTATGRPMVDYTFSLPAAADASDIRFHLLPTMRSDPTKRLRLAVGFDDLPAVPLDVPGGEAADENSGPRREGVMSNRVTLQLTPHPLSAGPHLIRVEAVDPGVVIDQVELPAGATAVAGPPS